MDLYLYSDISRAIIRETMAFPTVDCWTVSNCLVEDCTFQPLVWVP